MFVLVGSSFGCADNISKAQIYFLGSYRLVGGEHSVDRKSEIQE